MVKLSRTVGHVLQFANGLVGAFNPANGPVTPTGKPFVLPLARNFY